MTSHKVKHSMPQRRRPIIHRQQNRTYSLSGLYRKSLFSRPHHTFGRLRDEQQNELRTGGVQRVPQSCGRCRRGVKKRITFLRRRRRTSQTTTRESPRSLCIARSEDVRPCQVSVYDGLCFHGLTKTLSRLQAVRRRARNYC